MGRRYPHPAEPVRLKFFNKERDEIIKKCWRRFCKRVERIKKTSIKATREEPVKQRIQQEAGCQLRGVSGDSSAVVDEARWSRFWSWRRVIEWEKQKSYEERYEQLVKEIKI